MRHVSKGKEISRRGFLKLGSAGILSAALLLLSGCLGENEDDEDDDDDDGEEGGGAGRIQAGLAPEEGSLQRSFSLTLSSSSLR